MSEPKYLYRYMRMPSEAYKIIDLFLHNMLWFSSPKDFNDPFDSKLIMNFDELESNNESNWEIYIKFCEKYLHFPVDNSSQYEDKVRNWLITGEFITTDNLLSQNPENDIKTRYNILYPRDKYENFQSNKKNLLQFAKDIIKSEIQKQLDNARIIVFSELGVNNSININEINNSLLMWSHYADSHKGFCLEFDRNNLEKWVKEKNRVQNREIFFNKIDYVRDHRITFHDLFDADYKSKPLLMQKMMEWEYEKEWRICAYENDEGMDNLLLSPDILTGVVFGSEMSIANENAIVSLLKDRLESISFYKAYRELHKFDLHIEKIELSELKKRLSKQDNVLYREFKRKSPMNLGSI